MVCSKRGVKLFNKPQIGVLAPWSIHYLDQYNRYVRLSVRLLRDQAYPSHDADVTQLLLITGSLDEPPAWTAFSQSTCQQTVLFLAICCQMTYRCRGHWSPVHICGYKRVKRWAIIVPWNRINLLLNLAKMEKKCQIHALVSFSLQEKTTQNLSYCIGGPIDCPETSITTNLRCVTLQTSEDLTTADGAIRDTLYGI